MGLYLIAEGFSWLSLASWLAMFKVAFGLGMVIFVHELGHFMIAKFCGVKCEKFYVGFDFFDISIAGRVIIPRSLFKYQWGETEYGIGIIPLGGYVKMLGQDDDPTKYGDEMERSKAGDSKGANDQTEREKALAEGTAAEGLVVGQTIEKSNSDEELELDPRSYQAKTVLQRMAIISAGVIMNLIFAVIFATFAYKIGVANLSCIVGSTVPGGPAYRAGLMSGDKILQIGKNGVKSEYLRFQHDLFNAVVLNGDKKELEILVRRAATGKEEWLKVTPEEAIKGIGFPTIGVSPFATNKLSLSMPVLAQTPADDATAPLNSGDEIVQVDNTEIKDYVDLKAYSAQHPEGTLTYTVLRTTPSKDGKSKKTERIETKVEANPMRILGLVMTMGPIRGVQPDSPAATAGLKIGDVITKLNGEAIDPLTLPEALRRMAQSSEANIAEVELEILRDEKSMTVKVTPRPPTTSVGGGYQLDGPWLCDELGVAYSITNKLHHVDQEGPAAKSELKHGDTITKVEFIPAGEAKKKAEAERGSLDPIDLKKNNLSWPTVIGRLQVALDDTTVRVTYSRDDKENAVDITPAKSKDWFNPNRGFLLQSFEQTHTAESWGEAFTLGVRETKESAMKVWMFLQKLVTGKISPTNLGGPGSIAMVATSEASESTSRLLIFLTLLSANLAVVNFLPIPVLDGGHMMFLAYEGIFRRRPSERVFVGLSIAGLAFILSLMVFVIGLDVFRIAGYFMSG